MGDGFTDTSTIPEPLSDANSEKKPGFGSRLWSFCKAAGKGLAGSVMKLTSYVPCCRLIDGYNKAADNLLESAGKDLEVTTGGPGFTCDILKGLGRGLIVPVTFANGFFEGCGKGIDEISQGHILTGFGKFFSAGIGAGLTIFTGGTSKLLWAPIRRAGSAAMERFAINQIQEMHPLDDKRFLLENGRWPTREDRIAAAKEYSFKTFLDSFRVRNNREPTEAERELIRMESEFGYMHGRVPTAEESAQMQRQLDETRRGKGLSGTLHDAGDDITAGGRPLHVTPRVRPVKE